MNTHPTMNTLNGNGPVEIDDNQWDEIAGGKASNVFYDANVQQTGKVTGSFDYPATGQLPDKGASNVNNHVRNK